MPATATLKSRSIQGESLSAAADRLINSILLNEGVVDKTANSFQVTQNLGTDMNVKIGSGTAYDRAVVEGDNAGQGTFVVEHQNASQVLPIAASDPTNDRIDIVVLRVYDDTFDSSGNDYADLEIVQGTPAASPSPPAVPSSAIKLAEILVQNGVTQIVNGDITDFREEARLRPQAMPIVRGRASDDSGAVISTSETVAATASLTIPADWNTYDLEAICHVRVLESGSLTADRLVTGFLRLNGLGGSALGLTTVYLGTAPPNNVADATVAGFIEGLSTTGPITVTYSTQIAGDSGQAKYDDLRLIAKAIRTS